MRNGRTFQPVLLELVIVTLFLALSLSVIVRVLGEAGVQSRRGAFETEALLQLEDAMERTKADPVGDGAFDGDGVRRLEFAPANGVSVTGTVRAAPYGAGVYYEIALVASGSAGNVELTGARYVPNPLTQEVSVP